MTDDVKLLRFALAAIWTELEKDAPNLGDCQLIANEALAMTLDEANGKVPSDSTGLESWREHVRRRTQTFIIPDSYMTELTRLEPSSSQEQVRQ